MLKIELKFWILSFLNLIKVLYGRFFKQFLLLLFINQMASGLFRLMAALGRNVIVANTFGSFALLAVLVLGGFVLSRGESMMQLNLCRIFITSWLIFRH